MRISDWSSDVCSSDLRAIAGQYAEVMHLARFARLDDEAGLHPQALADQMMVDRRRRQRGRDCDAFGRGHAVGQYQDVLIRQHRVRRLVADALDGLLQPLGALRSEEHTPELPSLMRIPYS